MTQDDQQSKLSIPTKIVSWFANAIAKGIGFITGTNPKDWN